MRYANTLSLCQLTGLPAPCCPDRGADGDSVATVRTSRPVPARPGRAGRTPGDAGRSRYDGSAASATLRGIQPVGAGECDRTSARRDAAPAPDVNTEVVKPFARPLGLALPEWGADIPFQISVDLDASAQAEGYQAAEQKRLAALCDVLLKTGVLSSEDWKGALDTTITAALARFADTKMGCATLRKLWHLSLCWTTDITNGFEMDQSESGSWRTVFSPNMATDKPIGAFGLRGNGTENVGVSIERWATHIAKNVSDQVAGDCVGVLTAMVAFIGGWTPAWASDKAFDDADAYDGDDEELDETDTPNDDDDDAYNGTRHGLTPGGHLKWFVDTIPKYGLSYQYDLKRMETACAVAQQKKLPCLPMLQGSLRCARYLEKISEFGRPGDGQTHWGRSLCHLGFSYQCGMPPVLVFWKEDPDAATDPCVRIYDDWGDCLLSESAHDLVWLHGWDDEKPGGADTPGTISRAVFALVSTLGLVALLDNLIAMWQSAIPKAGRLQAKPLVQIFAEEDAIKTAAGVLEIAEELLCVS